jgi:hypothetical protein
MSPKPRITRSLSHARCEALGWGKTDVTQLGQGEKVERITFQMPTSQQVDNLYEFANQVYNREGHNADKNLSMPTLQG